MAAADYTTSAIVLKYLNFTLDADKQSLLPDWITAVSNFIENYTDREFNAAASATRHFDGDGSREFIIDDFDGTPTVIILNQDGTTFQELTEGQNQDYITFPYNKNRKYKLILKPTSTIGAFFRGKKNIKVVADFGFPDNVPKDIELAATMLIAEIAKNSSKGGSVQSESLGDYSVTFTNLATLEGIAGRIGVSALLDPYRIIEV